jgi:hypothetical protein
LVITTQGLWRTIYVVWQHLDKKEIFKDMSN